MFLFWVKNLQKFVYTELVEVQNSTKLEKLPCESSPEKVSCSRKSIQKFYNGKSMAKAPAPERRRERTMARSIM